MNKLQQWIDKYLVPVYERDGWLPTAIFLLLAGCIILLSLWLGGKEILDEVLK